MQPSKYFSILKLEIRLGFILFTYTPPLREPTLEEPRDYCDSLIEA